MQNSWWLKNRMGLGNGASVFIGSDSGPGWIVESDFSELLIEAIWISRFSSSNGKDPSLGFSDSRPPGESLSNETREQKLKSACELQEEP
jgi:hypothetical protein